MNPPEEIERLVEANAGLVVWALKPWLWMSEQGKQRDDDIVQAGFHGLFLAAQKFEPERGLQFSNLATRCIRQAGIRELRKQSSILHVPAKAFHARKPVPQVVSLDAPFQKGGHKEHPNQPQTWADLLFTLPEVEDNLKLKDVQVLVKEAMDALDFREKKVVEGVFWHGKNMADIGREVGISRQSIQQISTNAMRKMRQAVLDGRQDKVGVSWRLKKARMKEEVDFGKWWWVQLARGTKKRQHLKVKGKGDTLCGYEAKKECPKEKVKEGLMCMGCRKELMWRGVKG